MISNAPKQPEIIKYKERKAPNKSNNTYKMYNKNINGRLGNTLGHLGHKKSFLNKVDISVRHNGTGNIEIY